MLHFTRMRNPNRCPECGEHVSPFAAGCALCGAALDPTRGRTQTLRQRLRSAWRTPRLSRTRLKRPR